MVAATIARGGITRNPCTIPRGSRLHYAGIGNLETATVTFKWTDTWALVQNGRKYTIIFQIMHLRQVSLMFGRLCLD